MLTPGLPMRFRILTSPSLFFKSCKKSKKLSRVTNSLQRDISEKEGVLKHSPNF